MNFWENTRVPCQEQDSYPFPLSGISNKSVPASLALREEVINQVTTARNCLTCLGLSAGSLNIGDALSSPQNSIKGALLTEIRYRFKNTFGTPVLRQALNQTHKSQACERGTTSFLFGTQSWTGVFLRALPAHHSTVLMEIYYL